MLLVVRVMRKDNSMRYRNRNRYGRRGRGLGGLIVFVIIIFAIFSGRGFGSELFLPLLMVVLAFTTLIGSFFTLNPRGIYGGVQGFVWLLGLALCFAIGFWPWILLPIVLSALLGILARPLIAALVGMGLFSMLNRNQPPQPMYTPPMQPYQPPQQPYYQPPQPQTYQSYNEGYQSTPEQPSTYQEGGTQYQPYSSTPSQPYEQPQSQYPQQELPPQQ